MTDLNPSLPAWAEGKIAVDPDSGCWVWTGIMHTEGYGLVWIRCSCGEARRTKPAHRCMWEALVGPIPEGLQVDHLCRNRACVNPAHLEPVSSRENTLRGRSPAAVNAAKTHCRHGHPLSGDNVRIRTDGSRECLTCKRGYGRSENALVRARDAKRAKRAEARGGGPARMGPAPLVDNPETLAAIAEQYASGDSAAVVGRAFGIAGATVLRALQRHGIPTRPPGAHAPGRRAAATPEQGEGGR